MLTHDLHAKVARELESPFFNVPNDLPLNNFQAQFNEALLAMFAGYHPDAFWEVYEATEEDVKAPSEAGNVQENVPETIAEDDEGSKGEGEEDAPVQGEESGAIKGEPAKLPAEADAEAEAAN